MKSLKYKKYNLINSIVTQTDVATIATALDKDEPFTFTEWKSNSGLTENITDQSPLYNEYLVEWTNIKTLANQSSVHADTQAIFTDFLKQLPVEATDDELRYIDNIDYSDKYEVESALSFFTRKLKHTTHQISDNRQSVEFQSIKNSIRGSTSGVQTLIRDHVITLLKDGDFISDREISLSDKQKIIDELVISIDELYDESDSSVSSIEYDPDLHLNETKALQTLISKYGNVLSTNEQQILTDQGSELELLFTPDVSQITSLPQSEFEDYLSTGRLNLENIKRVVESSVNTRVDFLSSGLSGQTLTGTLFDSTDNLIQLDIKHDYGLTLDESVDVTTVNLCGGFYKPSKLGRMKYYSYDAKPVVKYHRLVAGSIHIHPDLTNYGSLKLDIPVDYSENFEYVKNNTLESGTPGEITHTISHIPRFNGYSSRNHDSSTTLHGVSRNDDEFDFWTGDVSDVWSKSDVFSLGISNEYEHESRQNNRLTNQGQLYSWKVDAYGNEFGLLKNIKPLERLTQQDFEPLQPVRACEVMDGDVFKTFNRTDPEYTRYINNETQIDNVSYFDISTMSHVANGMLFSRIGCDFNPVVQESVVVDIPSALPPGIVYCNILDGYVFTNPGTFKLRSTNNNNNFSSDPTIDRVWDCVNFDQTCIPSPITDVHYKTENINSYLDDDHVFVHTKISDGSSFEEVSLTDQPVTPGMLVVRTHDNTQIDNFDVVCKSIVASFPESIQNDIMNNVIDIDTIGDILIIETTNNMLFIRTSTNFSTSQIISTSNPIVIDKSNPGSPNQHHTSNWFYNKNSNTLLVSVIHTTNDSNFPQDEIISHVDTYWINVKNFVLRKTSHNINWVDGQGPLTSKSVTDIKNVMVSFNETLDKYYFTFMCNLSQSGIEPTFSIGQLSVTSPADDQAVFNVYTALVPAVNKALDWTGMKRQVIDRVYLPVSNIKQHHQGELTNGVIEFKNSILNNMRLDLTSLSPDKTASFVHVDFGDSETYDRHRMPVVIYRDIDTMVGTDSRDPRSYIVEHVYTNGVADQTCTITIHTLETPATPDVYTVNVIQGVTDMTTSFNRVIETDNMLTRDTTPGVEIHKTQVYTDKFGAENMLIVFKTLSPAYLIPIMLKLAEPLRRSTKFTLNTGELRNQTVMDSSRILDTYDTSV